MKISGIVYLDTADALKYLSQNARRASARKDTGLSVKLFRLWISIIKVYKGSISGPFRGSR